MTEPKHQWDITPPNGEKRVLVHSCCAPCVGGILEDLHQAGIEGSIFFYNPNIHPRDEYDRRKAEQGCLAQKNGIPFIDADYDPENWLERTRGMENEPERGKRCTLCFDIRLERTAQYAYDHGFKVFTSSLGLSRWKDMDQVNVCGIRAASRYPGLTYWTFNWRKKGGSQRAAMIAREEGLYRQKYCGCVFSLRDATRHSKSSGESG